MTEILKLQAQEDTEVQEDAPDSTASYFLCTKQQ
jgi:hypothetical protein